MKKSIVSLLALAAIAITSLGASAQASSFSELENQLQGLRARLQTDSVGDCVVPAASLALGSYGTEVKKLQVWLNQNGFPVVPIGKESQYFGPLTHFALIKFQASAGIRPVSGFYGPITQAEITKRCTARNNDVLGLRIASAADAPKGGEIPQGAQRVEIMRINVAGKSTLQSLMIHRFGDDDESGFSRVYLFDGDIRLTPGRAFNEETGIATFSDIGLVVDGTKTISIMAELANANKGVADGVEIVNVGSVSAQHAVSGSFPIRGGLFSRSDIDLGRVAIERVGDLSNPVIGQSAARVAEFQLVPEVGGDVLLKSLTLTTGGSVDPKQLSNFVLKHEGVAIAVASIVNARNQVLLRFENPFVIRASSRPKFELYADIGAMAEEGQTLSISLESPVDLYIASAARAAYAIPIDASNYNNTTEDGSDVSLVTVKGGVLTYIYRGPSVTHYAAGQNDVELMRFEMKTKNNIEVREMRFMLTAGGADALGGATTGGGLCNLLAANYTDIKLTDAKTGAVLTRSLNSACASGGDDNVRTFAFKERWRMAAGQTRIIKLTADIASFVPAQDETIKATMLVFMKGDIRNVDTGNDLNTREVVPPGSIVGATHRVYANEPVAALATTLASVLSEDSLSEN